MNQKSVLSDWIRKIFMAGVLGFMSYNTWHAIAKVQPDEVWMAWLGMFLFDFGAFAGYQMLIGEASGSQQRQTAKTILWGDFILAVGMVAGKLNLLTPAWISYLLLGAAAFNTWALYYYDTHRPEIIERSERQDEEDAQTDAARANRKMLFEESMKQANMTVLRESKPLGALMALRATARLKHGMGLPMTELELSAWNDDVIDAKALPVLDDNATPVQNLGFGDFLKSFFTRNWRTTQQGMPLSQEKDLALENSIEQKEVSQENQ
jgi:hypothetical protein